MDPNANLKEQLALAKQFVEQADQDIVTRSEFVSVDDAARLGELVIALNEWLKNGGFLPRDWKG